MNNDQRAFEQFMKRREEAASAYINGEAAPLGRLVTRTSPASFFAPMGGHVEGADRVFSRYERDATAFTPGSGEGRFEILQMAVSGDLGYWVGFQHATARVGGKTIPFELRVTEVFRREGDDWKLVHRHADSLMSEPEKQ
jgi:ketosteroid isomerase-like protein